MDECQNVLRPERIFASYLHTSETGCDTPHLLLTEEIVR
jgi:hypothetical protein